MSCGQRVIPGATNGASCGDDCECLPDGNPPPLRKAIVERSYSVGGPIHITAPTRRVGHLSNVQPPGLSLLGACRRLQGRRS
jgi:hypothetical protein